MGRNSTRLLTPFRIALVAVVIVCLHLAGADQTGFGSVVASKVPAVELLGPMSFGR